METGETIVYLSLVIIILITELALKKTRYFPLMYKMYKTMSFDLCIIIIIKMG